MCISEKRMRTCNLVQRRGNKPSDFPLRHLGSQRCHLVLPGHTYRETARLISVPQKPVYLDTVN